jgi:hypothetical protein
MDNETTLGPPPSRWLRDPALAFTWALISKYPDLWDSDLDIALLIGSEAPEGKDALDAITASVANCEDAAKASRQRAQQLLERAQRLEAGAESLRAALPELLDLLHIRKIDTPSGQLSLREAQPKVIITDPSSLPEQYVRTAIIRTPDKPSIRNALKAGEDVPGATLGNPGRIIQLKV